jgi:hypothetical protein
MPNSYFAPIKTLVAFGQLTLDSGAAGLQYAEHDFFLIEKIKYHVIWYQELYHSAYLLGHWSPMTDL